MIRLIPAVAPAVTPGNIAASVLRSRPGDAARFAAELATGADAEVVLLFGSGRAALSTWLRSLPRDGRDEVLVPAYTCWSVPAAVARAGLRVRVVDVDPATLDVDEAALARVADGRIAAAIGTHLFSGSSRMDRLAARFDAPGGPIAILEDAAQAWPRPGSASPFPVLLSFGRGKPLALGHGGALLLRDRSRVAELIPERGGYGSALEFAAVTVLARPSWYRLPESLPFLGVGTTRYDPQFVEGLPFYEWQGSLGSALLKRLPAVVAARTRNARRLGEAIGSVGGWRVPDPGFGDGPIRLPLLAPSKRVRDRFSAAMRRFGVASVPMYPTTVPDIPGLGGVLANPQESVPGAREIAARLVTVPTYPGLGDRDLNRIGEAIRRAAEEAGTE